MKLTKSEQKLHDEACKILQTEKLTSDQQEFVFEHWHPGAKHEIGKRGAFFTPEPLAWDLAVMMGPSGRMVDICGGIGRLSRSILDHSSEDITEIVIIEQCSDFIEVGKKLVPEATWIQGDFLDPNLWKKLESEIGYFDMGISNPPYGKLPNEFDGKWIGHKGPLHMKAAALLLKKCNHGGFMIIPEVDHSQLGYDKETSSNYKRFLKDFPGARIDRDSIEAAQYSHLWKGAAPTVELVNVSGGDPENQYFEKNFFLLSA